jgi:hypothetical protein
MADKIMEEQRDSGCTVAIKMERKDRSFIKKEEIQGSKEGKRV